MGRRGRFKPPPARTSLSRRISWRRIVTGVILIPSILAIDAWWIEPHWLDVSHAEVRSAKLDRRIRLVVLADLQTDQFGAYERRVLRRTLQEKPDLILFAGDYLQMEHQDQLERMRITYRDYLREIGFCAPLGIIAVVGNMDDMGWEKMFDGLPLIPVRNTRRFRFPGLTITALSMNESFNAFTPVGSAPGFHVVLGHSPDFALSRRVSADLLIAGHTHGGQVRIPFWGAIEWLSLVPRAWAAGWTKLPSGATLFVSRGIGMERGMAPRVRFWCRPELAVIDLIPERMEAHR